ncbi:ABC transporter ATP-binding protein [Algoriphagus winogradskyi]|uniref:ABC-type multidrug transport system, ATPase component n=1 Tax=Algoriphagus winogradskyi TaxID=237017 RepID=A0ABY1NFE0_9BACT|nr:ABC transporter ATP-binding protein [Algoriphagus winogradskyi]SMP08253.1 ABC-type multidrug transport system, ATPase component [Algoriphagus winogradskyi]
MNQLEIRNLSKTYPNGIKALNDISITITNGMFGLLGPNGAGKSSLMRTLATLQAAGSGEIFFNGQDVQKKPEIIRSVLGYLPQEFGVYPKVSALELLDHIAILKGITNSVQRKDQVHFLLQQTNLYDHRKKAVHSYSGGMKQRFGIAQALLGDPKLIIVDEPTAGLDPEERNRFLNLLSEIGENIIVILSTHLVDDVLELCPQMAIMNQGKIIKQGNPAVLTASLEGKIWRKKVSKSELPRYQQKLNIISSKLIAGETLIHVKADELPEVGFEQIKPSLEDFYFSTLQQTKQ